MKTVKAFDWWRETEGNGATVRKAWDAAQANMPVKTCEWTLGDPSNSKANWWSTGCGNEWGSVPAELFTFCPSCKGEIAMERTTEQKLEAMTKNRDDLQRKLDCMCTGMVK